MVNIASERELQKWLEGKPRDWALVLAARTALRALPTLVRMRDAHDFESNVVLPVVRAVFLAWTTARYPHRVLNSFAANAAAAHAATYDARTAARFAANAAAASTHERVIVNSISAASAAADDSSANFVDAVWPAISRDATRLEKGDNIFAVANSKLWPIKIPELSTRQFRQLTDVLIHLHSSWRTWIDWYQNILVGGGNFGLPVEIEEEVEIRIAQQSSSWWQRAPEVVNAEVAKWVEEQVVYEHISSLSDEKRTITGFIVDFLESHGAPATNKEIAEAFEAAQFPVIRKSMRGALSRLTSERRILRVDTGLYAARRSDDFQASPAFRGFPRLEPQISGALRFRAGSDGRVDVDPREGASDLLNDPDAVDRHSETARFAKRLIDSYDPSERGANAARETIEETRLLVEALGDEPGETRPGLLIPRGEALRQMLAVQESLDDLSDIAPLSDRFKTALRNLVGAYNIYVGLDPELARRDEARFGPDVEKDMASPESGMQAARSAADLGAATDRAAEALAEEAKVAPSQADVSNRLSRRFSEGVKNLARALLSKAVSGAKWVATHPLTSTGAAAGAGILACKWVIANEAWLTTTFASNPAMHEVVVKLVEIAKSLPIAGI